jgi:hypothetical protein
MAMSVFDMYGTSGVCCGKNSTVSVGLRKHRHNGDEGKATWLLGGRAQDDVSFEETA